MSIHVASLKCRGVAEKATRWIKQEFQHFRFIQFRNNLQGSRIRSTKQNLGKQHAALDVQIFTVQPSVGLAQLTIRNETKEKRLPDLSQHP